MAKTPYSKIWTPGQIVIQKDRHCIPTTKGSGRKDLNWRPPPSDDLHGSPEGRLTANGMLLIYGKQNTTEND